jgi:hypothetical protein
MKNSSGFAMLFINKLRENILHKAQMPLWAAVITSLQSNVVDLDE